MYVTTCSGLVDFKTPGHGANAPSPWPAKLRSYTCKIRMSYKIYAGRISPSDQPQPPSNIIIICRLVEKQPTSAAPVRNAREGSLLTCLGSSRLTPNAEERLEIAEATCVRDSSDGKSPSTEARCSSTDNIMVGVSTLMISAGRGGKVLRDEPRVRMGIGAPGWRLGQR